MKFLMIKNWTAIITGTVVGRVEATDQDSSPEFRRVQYFTDEDDDEDFPGFFIFRTLPDCVITSQRCVSTTL